VQRDGVQHAYIAHWHTRQQDQQHRKHSARRARPGAQQHAVRATDVRWRASLLSPAAENCRAATSPYYDCRQGVDVVQGAREGQQQQAQRNQAFLRQAGQLRGLSTCGEGCAMPCQPVRLLYPSYPANSCTSMPTPFILILLLEP
jgi:hypothetical protein